MSIDSMMMLMTTTAAAVVMVIVLVALRVWQHVMLAFVLLARHLPTPSKNNFINQLVYYYFENCKMNDENWGNYSFLSLCI
jgi:hypothetical protein